MSDVAELRSDPDAWLDANQRYVMRALDVVRILIEQHGARSRGAAFDAERLEKARREESAAERALPAASALQGLVASFGLSHFERNVLLMCAGSDLDAGFGAACSNAPTFSLALAALPEAHWSALAPAAPLRAWRLIEVRGDGALTRTPLRADERILHCITGVQYLDERLRGIVHPRPDADELSPSHECHAASIAAAWQKAGNAAQLPIVQLYGDRSSSRKIAAAASRLLGLKLYVLAARDLPERGADSNVFLTLWQREAILSGNSLLVECDEQLDDGKEAALRCLMESARGAIFIFDRLRRAQCERASLLVDVAMPNASEQRAMWTQALAKSHICGEKCVDLLASQFRLSASTIQNAVDAAANAGEQPGETVLWDIVRASTRARLDHLADRIVTAAAWSDLVLPEQQRAQLREIAIHVRRRYTVYERWGFERAGARGLGITVLFSGRSGTGKTLAAEVLANELRLDLYRIDLSQVVSKYIGDTEKNIRRVFDAADEGGAILLFDEAEALFGKRSEVHDSHDRYANIEISYLLQRMEAYRGLAILTSNMKASLDPAFLRRIRFVVHFPMPDAALRAQIWKCVIPEHAPAQGLDFGKLARLGVAGGSIRNIALHAAFLAADAPEPLNMQHMLKAARNECMKIEKPLSDAETRDWIE